MESWENIHTYQKVLLDCYGLWSWRLNAKLDVVGTNCDLPNLFGKLLVSEERVEILREHLNQESMPLILGNAIGLLWAVVPVSLTTGKELLAVYPRRHRGRPVRRHGLHPQRYLYRRGGRLPDYQPDRGGEPRDV